MVRSGRERCKREGIYVCIELIHFVVQQKQHNAVKQLYFNKKIIIKLTQNHKTQRDVLRGWADSFSLTVKVFSRQFIFLLS